MGACILSLLFAKVLSVVNQGKHVSGYSCRRASVREFARFVAQDRHGQYSGKNNQLRQRDTADN